MVDEKSVNLEANQSDYWPTHMRLVAGAGGAIAGGPLGAIAGAVLGEILAQTIPNQRLDRVATYIKNLQANFSEVDFERMKSIPEKVALIEEGMLAAGLTPQKEKIERISNFISNGLSKNEVDLENESYLLNIIKSVTSSDIVVLKYYQIISDDSLEQNSPIISSYIEKHDTIFNFKQNKTRININISDEKHERLNGHERYLLSFGLLRENIKRLRMPETLNRGNQLTFDTNNALNDAFRKLASTINSTSYKITNLGIDLLCKIEPIKNNG